MQKNENLSVILPVYNGELFVTAAIQSVLSQTVPVLEIIVIDDASKDRTREIIHEAFPDQLKQGFIRYECNEQNRERSYSRNRGAELARGEYIFFLDHDDLWSENYLASVTAQFVTEQCDIVYTFPRTFVDEAGEVIRRSSKYISPDCLELLFGSQVGYPSATAFRRSSFAGYSESCILREDWEIFLRASLAGQRISILDSDQVMMRAHGGRSSSKSVKFWSSTLWVYHRYKDQIPSQYRGVFLYHVADICFRYGDIPHGWLLSLQALAGGKLPGFRMLHRLLTRGVRVDRYFSLAGERNRLGILEQR